MLEKFCVCLEGSETGNREQETAPFEYNEDQNLLLF